MSMRRLHRTGSSNFIFRLADRLVNAESRRIEAVGSSLPRLLAQALVLFNAKTYTLYIAACAPPISRNRYAQSSA